MSSFRKVESIQINFTLFTKIKIMKKLFFALALLTLPLVACNRYDEGSNFSFLTAKARAVGEWVVTSITTDGQDVTNNFPNIQVSIKDDNTYKITFSVFGFKSYENGTWTLSDDKKRLLMTSSTGNLADRRIIMLKNKMMKLEEINSTSGAVTVWTLEQ